jgi:diaminohydroxyphosphoribosylaminopyrimidine deaminase/5-amino-6-(5-phosphoribosylamino)uracil reductase
MINPIDLTYMEMAYGLAEKAVGRASPNPCVGAVIVRHGHVVGAGWHQGPGTLHAESIAVCQAGRLAEGATLYLTLEPCVHWGHTPPCLESLLQARLGRVVISSYDPNPLVFRKGVRGLRRAGLPVLVGTLEDKNLRLNEAYFKFIQRKIPFVTLKAASTLDGRIATRTGDSRWISSPAARDYVHLLRAEQDAVLVGVGTVLRDDPLLSVRHPLWKGKRLQRVILDSHLRTPLTCRMLKSREAGGILIFTGRLSSQDKARKLENRGVEVVRLDSPEGGGRSPRQPGQGPSLSLRAVLKELGRRKVAGLLVEGGSGVASAFLEAGLVDKLFLTLSPRLCGGRQALSFYEGRGAALIRNAPGLKNVHFFALDQEIFIEGYL